MPSEYFPVPTVDSQDKHLPGTPTIPAQAILIASSLFVTGVAISFWFLGVVHPFHKLQVSFLLGSLLFLNFTPLFLELKKREFDPFDPIHIFLGYFFLIFTLNSWCRVGFGINTNPGFETQNPSEELEIRALSVIVVGLSCFIVGCYLPIGRKLGRSLTRLPEVSRFRTWSAAIAGILVGLVAYIELVRSAGGFDSFIAGLGYWRTMGVISGVGYLTFPISVILPISVLLLLLTVLPVSPKRMTLSAFGVLSLYFVSLGLILVMGFRVSLVPAILQLVASWHYKRRRIRVGKVFLFALLASVLLTSYVSVRGRLDTILDETPSPLSALIFRVAGFETIQRVINQLDVGEPHRGITKGLVESATILVPRVIWGTKPNAASLSFADIFFFDYFLARGDPFDGIKSGLPPTLIGELLWIGGLPFVVIGAALLGLSRAVINSWRMLDSKKNLHILVAAIFMGSFALFVEAPQNALNAFTMMTTYCVSLIIFLTIKVRRTLATSRPTKN